MSEALDRPDATSGGGRPTNNSRLHSSLATPDANDADNAKKFKRADVATDSRQSPLAKRFIFSVLDAGTQTTQTHTPIARLCVRSVKAHRTERSNAAKDPESKPAHFTNTT